MFFSASPEAMKHMKEKHNDQSSDTQGLTLVAVFFPAYFLTSILLQGESLVLSC